MKHAKQSADFPGYTLSLPFCEGEDFVIYRALRQRDQEPVFLKVPVSPRPPPALIHQLEHEYEVARELDPALTLRPVTLERVAGNVSLVLENTACEPITGRAPMQVEQFLPIAIGVAVALAEMHRRGFIHRDVKPANLFLDADGHVRLSGLGQASRLSREREAAKPPELIAGTLAYMAPEQTGRMNRSVDSRSDLYAAGVTFYELLTGELPFTAADPMEWVHCHIARIAVPPRERNAAIPEPLSSLIIKLLAKSAEERYQTAQGLAADLRRCLAEWKLSGRISSFPLGACDVPDRLLIPEKLYGREREIDALVRAFDRVVSRGTTELVLVAGYSGIGKSSVVNELHKVLVPPRGLFGAGKFDQYKRDIPYSTLGQAFQAIIRHVLAQSDREVACWRDSLHKALDPNGRLMTDLIPELEHLIGPQPSVPSLPPQEARNLFQTVFRRFLGVFARPEHPLALFLDDLQWLDAATLELVERLLTDPEPGCLLLVGAYRDNEVTSSHPLTRTLEAIKKASAEKIHEITLSPLALSDLAHLLADALHSEEQHVWPLAQLVYEKTGGNPFFSIQFLTMLADEQLVAFDPATVRWTWDVTRIRAKNCTDNIVDLMAGKLNRLPESTRAILAQFACLGNTADVAMLALVHEKPEDKIHAALWPAICAGLLIRFGGEYRFLHDRVQEAAYLLIAEEERDLEHLRIGRLLASRTAPDELEENIFGIVNQLDRAISLMTSPEEREQVAKLNLTAGERAKKATAYQSALRYLSVGRTLLAKECWDRLYELTYSLEINRAECQFLTGEFTAAEERLLELSRHAANAVDMAGIAYLRMELYQTLDQSDRSVEVCLDYLRSIGIEFSPHPTEDQVRQEYEQIWNRVADRPIEDLLSLPEMIDPNWRATMDVLTAGLVPAYFFDENLRDLITCRMVNLSLEHGNSDASSFGYVHLGMVLGPKFGDYDAAFRFGKVAVDLAEMRGLDRFKARVQLCFGGLIALWNRPLRECRSFLRVAFDLASRTGDVTFAMYSIRFLAANQFASGENLGDTQIETESALKFARKVRFGGFIDMITTELKLIRMLRGFAPTFSCLNDTEFNESSFELRCEANPRLAVSTAFYWVCKMQARFHGGDYGSAMEALFKADKQIWALTSLIHTAEYHFWGALTRAAYYAMARADEKPELMKALGVHEAQLQLWAKSCPENFGSSAALASAEIARIEDRDREAMDLYEKAIALARENGCVNNEAVACERIALFFQDRKLEPAARAYLQEAAYCYARWGADGKVRQLQERFPFLNERRKPVESGRIGPAPEQLDLLTVVKAQQAISGEIVIERLAEALLRIALENAGACKGYLFVEPDIELLAMASTRQDNSVEFRRGPLSPDLDFSTAVLNYVKRTHQAVLIKDAMIDAGEFLEDEYFQRAKPRSLLCMPILRQAKLIGTLCLENDAVAGAFTSDRRGVLEMIASQAAISLETARLYSDLERSQNDLQNQTDTLEASEERLRMVLENSKTGTWDWDLVADVQVWSERCYALLGLPPGSPPTYECFLKTLHPEDRDRIDRAVREALDQRSDYSVELRCVWADGSIHWLAARGKATYDSTGKPVRMSGVILDITERKSIEEEIRKLNAELEQRVLERTKELQAANKELETFSYSVSHDLRAPLRSIEGFSRSLLKSCGGHINPEGEENLGRVITACKHMGQLIDGILQLSRLTRSEVRRCRLDLSKLASSLAKDLQQIEPERRVKFVIEPDLVAEADPVLMQSVLENLIGNAWKFTGKIPAAHIEFGRYPQEGGPTFFVRDNGAGFDMAYADKLFSEFQRLHSVKEFPGTGIGLATVQRIIQKHGGRIWAESEVDKGATFYFTLPSPRSLQATKQEQALLHAN